MNLLLGNDVDLITVDLPEVEIGTDTTSDPWEPLDTVTFLQGPIIPLVFLNIGGGVQARFNLDFGFNSRGLTDPALNPLDGIYIVDHPADYEMLLRAAFSLGVAFDIGIISVEGAGDIAGDLFLDLAR